MTPIVEPTPWRDIDNAIHAWFAESTGLQVIWANQDAPQPDWPYGLLNRIVGGTKVGQDGVRYSVDVPTGRLDATFCGLRQFTVSCQIDLGPIGKCKGFDAMAVMAAAQMALKFPATLDRFRGIDIACFNDNEPINQFDVVVGDTWNSRAQMDLDFYTSANVTETDVDAFDSVNISSDIAGLEPSLNLDDENFGG